VELIAEFIRRQAEKLANLNGSSSNVREKNGLRAKLAMAYLTNDDPIAAVQVLLGADSSDPLHADVKLLKVLALLKTGEHEFAAECLKSYVRNLSEALPLRIISAVFVKNFYTYGIYELHAPLFRAGDRARIFVPLDNFACRRMADSFKVEVSVKCRILNADGEIVDERDPKRDSRLMRNHVRDFCPDFSYLIPQGIAPGNYIFEIEITDEQATIRTPAKRSINFKIEK